MPRTAFIALAAGLLLAACGETTTERALTGAGIGAAAGGAGSGIAGGDVLTGAAIGGAAGAAAGALTEEEQLDLGDPIWERF